MFTLGLGIALLACNPKDEVVDVRSLGIERISRIELSANGPQLVRDGVNALNFNVRCFYSADADKTREVLFLGDRLPLDKINITSSDGQIFKANESYSTTSTEEEISFTAHINKLSSAPTSVSLIDADTEVYPDLRIPLTFHIVYAPRDIVYVDQLDATTLGAMVDRANKVFAGSLYKAPSTGNARMQFYIKDITRNAIEEESGRYNKLPGYIRDNLMTGSDKTVHIWLLSSSVLTNLESRKVKPSYTQGEPDDIQGLRLSKVTSVDTDKHKITLANGKEKELNPTDVGITMSFTDVYRNAVGSSGFRFETLLGQYYGLLSTGYNAKVEAYTGDTDYCPDTYSYDVRLGETLKHVMTKDTSASPIIYKSYNIMDKNGACLALSQAQVKRIRQVVKDCPYRGQGHP